MKQEHLTLVCLGHLNWDFVWQRPQQLMSRFARHCRVIYIDPPEIRANAASSRVEERPGAYNVRVFRPIIPEHLFAIPSRRFQELWRQLSAILQGVGKNTILWTFSPAVAPLVSATRSSVSCVVYDCMDDFFSLLDTPDAAMMRQNETQMLEVADLLFTGGHSMFEARKMRHPRAYCFPSGVNQEDYRPVHAPQTELPAPITAISSPRLGYLGVVDERIDWTLIATIAEHRPSWHWVMVGPVGGNVAGEVPLAPNIHYMGQQPYQELPGYLKGFDIATVPFAINQTTRFMSPTKTLEYMAGGKPVISTSLPDVVTAFTGIVKLADTADEWIAAVDAVLAAPAEQKQHYMSSIRHILEENSWDTIAARMWSLIQACVLVV